ncbi:hypothetical protein [Maricaulis parjimensis]|uniref:hypothetical protein n=1 Tax=Maricaulis parjimensis TaxID=144023 RepID=UPI0019396C87|nr:hypothetical protein [Maricaulis parjimensis]
MLPMLMVATSLQTAEPAGDIAAEAALIEQARQIIADQGAALWPGYDTAPGTILLIKDEQEFLLCHHRQAGGFSDPQDAPVSGCRMQTRARQFNPAFLASFPAVEGTPTMVVGTPEATGRSPDAWMLTLLHEHLHQFQDSLPGQWDATLALDLDGGDTSGMWMLNYPFPYETAAPAARALADQALRTLAARGSADFAAEARAYAEARQAFRAGLSPAEARYYDFQIWKEGVARWVELELARMVAAGQPELAHLAEGQEDRLIASLESMNMTAWQREVFYGMGAADAEILDQTDPAWRELYLSHRFDMNAIFEAVLPTAND